MALLYPAAKIFATKGSTDLTSAVYRELVELWPGELSPGGVHLGKVKVDRFANENLLVQIDEAAGMFAIVIHTQTPPVNEGLIELFHLLDAIKNAKPTDILVVFPYMPYSRSDKKDQPRISTFAKVMADILTKAFGIERVIILDPHDSHTKHYFNPAADEISAIYLLVDFLMREIFTPEIRKNSVVVFSDSGSAKRYNFVPGLLGIPEAYISKQRSNNRETPEIKQVVGEVDGRICLLVDDEITTGGTVVGDAQFLRSVGAKEIYVLAVHPIFARNGCLISEFIEGLEQSPITRFIVADTVPIVHKIGGGSKITVIPVARLLAHAILRTIFPGTGSLSDLHSLLRVPTYRQKYS